MKLLKIITLLGVTAFLLPSTLWDDQSDLVQSFGSGEFPVGDEPSIPELVGSGLHYAATLCENQPLVCEVRDAAVRKLHVFAIDATGSLHSWLKEGLDEEDRA